MAARSELRAHELRATGDERVEKAFLQSGCPAACMDMKAHAEFVCPQARRDDVWIEPGKRCLRRRRGLVGAVDLRPCAPPPLCRQTAGEWHMYKGTGLYCHVERHLRRPSERIFEVDTPRPAQRTIGHVVEGERNSAIRCQA